jgi:hypothetical protein
VRNKFCAYLDPTALAVAGGAATLAVALLSSFGMMGFGSMMGGGSTMTFGASSHMGFAGGLTIIAFLFLGGLVAGLIVALVYNAVLPGRDIVEPDAPTHATSMKGPR